MIQKKMQIFFVLDYHLSQRNRLSRRRQAHEQLVHLTCKHTCGKVAFSVKEKSATSF